MSSDEKNNCSACAKTPKWKQDFPIEWEGDHYVTRREMVKFMTLGSFLLAAANWITAIAGRFLHLGARVERDIGSVSALEENGLLLFRYPTDRDPCIAVRTPQGKLVAYSQVCTHLSCAVVYNQKVNALLCPCHRGEFSIDTGAPVAGPPSRPLARIHIEQRGNRLIAMEMEA
jgi:nitrite reductase/ring-hydroxylating ferredoxin subunit